MRRILLSMAALALLAAPSGRSLAGGVTRCATSDTTVGGSGTQSALFQPYRKGTPSEDLTARDFELLWDVLYGGLDPDTRTTLGNFVRSLVEPPGLAPAMTDAVNVQAVYNQLRREGADWNINPQDSTAFKVGRTFGSGQDINTYPDRDRAHADVYLFHPTRPTTPPNADGSWPSKFSTVDEDLSTGHPLGDVLYLNSMMVRGPSGAEAVDLSGAGWTSPTAVHRLRVNHELQHSLPPGDGGLIGSEFWSAAAEAVGGIHDTTATDEVPYTWPLVSAFGGPSCTFLRTSSSNYQARTSFMAYVAYNFPNADTNRTLAGSADDLLTRWAKQPSSRRLSELQPLLSDANCATCASKSYFHPPGPALTSRERLNLLLHNWRVANFVNNPALAEGQYGYPAWSGFSPATHQKAWQDFDNCKTDDIVAMPATVTLTSQQLTKDVVLNGTRAFRESTFPLSIAPFAAQYWVIRAGDGLMSADRDLVTRVSSRTGFDCRVPTSRRDVSLLASAVAYDRYDTSGEESVLWQYPGSAVFATSVGMADVDSVTGPIELVVPSFGVTHRAVLVVLTLGDGRLNALYPENDVNYAEAIPYRLEIGARVPPYMATSPLPVSTIPGQVDGMPTWAPTSDEVAYFTLDPAISPKSQIFRRKLDGSAPVRVVAQPFSQFAPDWSPRGDAIAYEGAATDSTSSIWIADLGPSGTGTPRQVTSLPGCASMPTFQPNGQGIAYTYLPPFSNTSYLRWVALDGTGDVQLADLGSTASFRLRPRWSFDGSRIYISRPDLGDQVCWVPRSGGAPFADNTINMPAKNVDLHPGIGRILLETTVPLKNNALENEVGFGCWDPPSPPSIAATRIALLDTALSSRDTSYRVVDRVLIPEYPTYSLDGTRIAYQLRDPRNSDVDVHVRQTSWNHPPSFGSTMGDKSISACVPFQMALLSTDPDGEPPTYAASFLPSGSQIINGNTFRWQHPSVGTYFAVFRARDGSGGVDSRVVRFSVYDDGNCGDPFVEGDGGCGACLRGGPGSANSFAVASEEALEGAPGSSFMSGVSPGRWETQTARLSRLGADHDGNFSASLRATLAGTASIDRARIHVVDHPLDAQAVSASSGILVGHQAPLVKVVDDRGQDVLAALEAAARVRQPLDLPAGSVLLAHWPGMEVISGLAIDCSLGGVPGWGSELGIEVQVPEASGWRTIDRLRPRRGFDLLGCLVPGGHSARLVLLSDTRLRTLSGFITSPEMESWCSRRSFPVHRSNRDIESLAETDALTVNLAQGETVSLGLPRLEPVGMLARSYFLEMRAAFTLSAGAASQKAGPAADRLPASYALFPSQPNPSRGRAIFRFDIPRPSQVRIELFDPLGRRVRTLLDGPVDAGSQVLPWDGRDERGGRLGPGVYLYRMTAGPFTAERRLVLLAGP